MPIVDQLASLLIRSLLVFVLAALGLLAVRLLDRRARRLVRLAAEVRPERDRQLTTLVQIFRWAATVLILTLALLMLLSIFGVPITPLLTGAGIVGLAISLGAQTLIRDLIGGFLILAENQYAVGDVIEVAGVSGVVERLTLRVTHVRDVGGRLHIVPNGEVRLVSNATKGWARALVDVGVAYEEDLERVRRVLQDVAARFAQDEQFGSQLLETPQILVPFALGDWAVTVRLMVKTQPGQQWEIARQLQKHILDAFEREGIEMPYPQQVTWLRCHESPKTA